MARLARLGRCLPCYTPEAPLEWLVANTSKAATGIILFLGLSLGGSGLGFVAAEELMDGLTYLLAASTLILLATAMGLTARRNSQGFEMLSFVGYCIAILVITVGAYFVPDPKLRHARLGEALWVIKPLPILGGMRRLPYVAFLTLDLALQLGVNILSASRYEETLPISEYIPIIIPALAYAVASQMAHGWIFAVYEAQWQLAQEKETHESLVANTYDATLWLAGDRDTITHSDRNFEDIVGTAAPGTKLSSYVRQTAEEQARLQEAFERFPVGCPGMPVVALTTTLRATEPDNVELYIVNRSLQTPLRRGAEGRGSFLVGLRLQGVEVQPFSAEPDWLTAPPAEPARAGAPAAAPHEDMTAGSFGSDVEWEQAAALLRFEEVAVTFELGSERLSVWHLGLRFAPEPGLPPFAKWLREPAEGRFRAWAQRQAGAGRAPGDRAPAPDYGRVMFEVPALGFGQGTMLVGNSALLDVAEADAEGGGGPQLATLRITSLCQGHFQPCMRGVPLRGIAEEHVAARVILNL